MQIQDLVKEKIIGNIKIGTKSETGLPKKLPYFNVEEDKTTTIEMVNIFKQLYPNKATNLKIMFTTENPFSFRYKRYVNNKVVCMGNDKTAITIGKDSKGRKTQVEVVCNKECEHRACGKCKLVGSLKFVLVGINAGGVWKINTSGGISLTNIASEIYKYKVAGMSIIGVPFELTLTEHEPIGYASYYSINLHRTDIKPQLVGDTKPQLPEGNSNIDENKKETKTTEKKSELKETEKSKPKSEKEVKQKIDKEKDEANDNTKQEVKNEEIDLSKRFVVKGFMPTLINNIKLNKIILQDTSCQNVEYILHPDADQTILEHGAGTLIEIKKTIMEMNKNILCKYEILQLVAPDGSMTDYNLDKEELKEAV